MFKLDKTKLLGKRNYTLDFGIVNSELVVSGINLAYILTLTDEQIEYFFQPNVCRYFHIHAQRTYIYGHISQNDADFTIDLSELSQLSNKFAINQFLDPMVKDMFCKNIKNSFKMRDPRTQTFYDILIKIFKESKIHVSLTHFTEVNTYFGANDKSLLSVVKAITRNIDRFEQIAYYNLPSDTEIKTFWFYNYILSSIFMVFNSDRNSASFDQRRDELRQRYQEIKNGRYEVSEDERAALLELIKVAQEKGNVKKSLFLKQEVCNG